MALLSLSNAEYDELIRIHQTSDDKRLHDRARAMIILGNGESIDRTAEFLKVSPRTIYAWLHRFTEDSSLPIETRLKDKPRSGRPHKTFTTAKEILNERDGWNIEDWPAELPRGRRRKPREELTPEERSDEDKIHNLIFQLLSNPPHRAGYKNSMWHFELLNQCIKESFHFEIGRESVQNVINNHPDLLKNYRRSEDVH
jgi:hypothetical protein